MMDFYDGLAGQYEQIVSGPNRLGTARKFGVWLHSLGVATVLDVACGSGLHAHELAALEIDVTASDASEEMLKKATHCKLQDIKKPDIHWLCCPMQSIAQKVTGPFDAVICMGNSLPHLLTDNDLAATFDAFYKLTNTGGIAVIQILNYTRILKTGSRIIGITRDGDSEYLRFYDFGSKTLSFNILEMHWHDRQCDYHLHQTQLRPYQMGQLGLALQDAGFGSIEMFDGLDFNSFDEAESDSLLIMAMH